MSVEVLLRRTIEGVGEVGDVVRVKNGYARNFLLPNGYAAFVSADAMRRIEKDKEIEGKRLAELRAHHESLAKALAEVKITIEARAGEDGHLYGSVGVKHILAALEEQGYPFEARQIRFDSVRELGEYEFEVQLSSDIVVPMQLWVVQDAVDAMEEAEEARRRAELGEEAEGEGEGTESAASDLPEDAPTAETAAEPEDVA